MVTVLTALDLFTDEQLETLNDARRILKNAERRAGTIGHDVGKLRAIDYTQPNEQAFGRMAERIHSAEYAIFEVFNCLTSYLNVPVSDRLVYCRTQAEQDLIDMEEERQRVAAQEA